MHPFYWYLTYAFAQALWVCRDEYRRNGFTPIGFALAFLVASALAPFVSVFLILKVLVTVNNKKT